MPNPFKRIRKLRGLASLPLLDGRRRRAESVLPPLSAGLRSVFDVTDDRQQELAHVLKDEELARRVVALEDVHPYGTLPELVMLDYLQRVGERYTFQAQLMGGFRSGGLVPDFVVSRNGNALALNIQGDYWHDVPGKKIKDASDKQRILGQYYEGELITNVVFVWEKRLMAVDRESVMASALAGVEVGE